ncbi:MAG: ABC transporter substrate-binding protein [Hahellaceae bacterium]|nr:ABC transporter substrate-binding protein [Hahellaceae bacterium]
MNNNLIKKLSLLAPCLLLAIGLFASASSAAIVNGISNPTTIQRVISLAPSITEILYAIGAGQSVVGITRYCNYPPETAKVARIGGYYDPNYEAILSLHPSLVIRLTEHTQASQLLQSLDIKSLEVNHQSLQGILNSISMIGKATGYATRAEQLKQKIENQLEMLAEFSLNQPTKSVLIAFARPAGQETINKLYIAGKEAFYSPILEKIHATNAYQGDVAFPVISAEGLIQMRPDVVIDITPDPETSPEKESQALQQWIRTFPPGTLTKQQIHILPFDFMVIPGPRIDKLATELTRAIYPELSIPTLDAN